MRIFIQRVRGSTKIQSDLGNGRVVNNGFDGPGLVVLLGWLKGDETRKDLDAAEDWLLGRALGLRIFPDNDKRMNLNLPDYLAGTKSEGGILWVPQFTLAAEFDSGFRPSFTNAMHPDQAHERFLKWITKLPGENSLKHIHGHFGAEMQLSFSNWGPVSLLLER